MFQGITEEEWRRIEEKQTVYQEGPGGLSESAGEELPPVHGLPQATDPASRGPGQCVSRSEVSHVSSKLQTPKTRLIPCTCPSHFGFDTQGCRLVTSPINCAAHIHFPKV